MTEPSDVVYRNIRLNILACAAFIVVILCIGVAVWMTDIGEYAKGIVTFVLGRFSGYVDSIYNFEFGKTRGSEAKDATITNLAAGTPTAATAALTAALNENSAKVLANTEKVDGIPKT